MQPRRVDILPVVVKRCELHGFREQLLPFTLADLLERLFVVVNQNQILVPLLASHVQKDFYAIADTPLVAFQETATAGWQLLSNEKRLCPRHERVAQRHPVIHGRDPSRRRRISRTRGA
jgi:hypothetical protein